MISIGLLYTNTRAIQATTVATTITSIPYNRTFDLMQIVDGTKYNPLPGFRTITVERKHKYFYKKELIDTAFNAAKKNVVLIIDCDRLLDKEFIYQAATINKNQCIFCKSIHNLTSQNNNHKLYTDQLDSVATIENRVEFRDGTIEPAKTPTSGAFALHKSDYLRKPTWNSDFIGWGFNDTDLYTHLYFNGIEFISTNHTEVHLYHQYEIPKIKLLAMNAWNGIKYYRKWNLPIPTTMSELFSYLRVEMNTVQDTTIEQFINHVQSRKLPSHNFSIQKPVERLSNIS